MALLISDCKHDARRPFRGMRRVGFEGDDLVLFRCAICMAEYSGQRCAADAKLSRCRNVVFDGTDVCRQHGVLRAQGR